MSYGPSIAEGAIGFGATILFLFIIVLIWSIWSYNREQKKDSK